MRQNIGEFTTLMARDGHEFQAYLAAPKGKARGAIVVMQEIFGVNHHIRAVTDGYAAAGYVAIAPAMFDRVRRGIELGYNADTMQEGVGYMMQSKPEQAMADIGAAVAVVKHAGRVGIVGYCWGGRNAYLAARDLPVAAAVAYYGGGIAQNLDRVPSKPVMYHHGLLDTHIPMTDVAKIKAAHPAGIFHEYQADHGFNCDERGAYDAASAKLALQRTLEFFQRTVDPPAA